MVVDVDVDVEVVVGACVVVAAAVDVVDEGAMAVVVTTVVVVATIVVGDTAVVIDLSTWDVAVIETATSDDRLTLSIPTETASSAAQDASTRAAKPNVINIFI